MFKKIIVLGLICSLFITPIFASHDIVINEKRVLGDGDNIIFIIGEKVSKTNDGTSWEEYPVSIGDYEKIQIGDKITVDGYNETSKLFSIRIKEKSC